jgi:hypothetical protein
MMSEAMTVHLLDSLNHLDEDVREGHLVEDAISLKVLLN